MGKRAGALATSSIIAGLFLGIYVYTGISIDPMDFLKMFAKALTGQLAPQYSNLIGAALTMLTIVGIWQTFSLIMSGLKYRILGLVMTITGFVGGIILLFSPITGLFFLAVSILFGRFL
jgi:hypothetical protein